MVNQVPEQRIHGESLVGTRRDARINGEWRKKKSSCLKVDDDNRAEYEAAGMEPFKPYPGRSQTMKYYEVPLVVLESQMELAAWAR